MADPTAIAGAGLVSTIVGGIIGAKGAATQSQGQQLALQGQKDQILAQQKAYQYQAGIAQVNQQIEKQNADYARQTGEITAARSGMEARFQAGQTRATFGASGLDVNTGSHAEVTSSMHEIALQNEGTIRATAAKQAYGYDVAAVGEGAKATLAGLSADSAGRAAGNIDTAIGYAKKAGSTAVASSILGTASSVSSKWLQGSQVGLFNTKSSTSPASSWDGNAFGLY